MSFKKKRVREKRKMVAFSLNIIKTDEPWIYIPMSKSLNVTKSI